jgi:para-aminobenzoate synthetase component 1
VPWQRKKVDEPVDWPAAVRAWGGPDTSWLDSSDRVGRGEASYSIVAGRPLAVIEQFDGQAAELKINGRVADRDASGWRLWRRACAAVPANPPREAPLGPGWIGYVGYEMARQLELLPSRRREPLGLPMMRLALCDTAIVRHHHSGGIELVRAVGLAEALGVESDPLARELERWAECHLATGGVRAPARRVQAVYEMAHQDYLRRVERAIEYIAAGDIYQVNLAHRIAFQHLGDPLAHYARLRAANPAPYGALLRWPGAGVASISPEMFLSVRGRDVRTRPIKGTATRTGDDILDAANKQRLLDSPKEAAELAMIVDLHRNDLGRVCVPGSVRVTDARRLEAHPTVFHTVAQITGTLQEGRNSIDALEACFPAGSITGVPKIRAMQIIDELEPVGRGAYTGAIVNLALDGQLSANVAIRTLQFAGPVGAAYVGGGIVADSDPHDEYAETLAKARGMLAGMGVVVAGTDERAKSDVR